MTQEVTPDTPNLQFEIANPSVMAITPVVSVAMITYNHGPYLAEAIEGVVAQKTDFPIELIIGEDCSIDNTRDIAMDYQRRYPHIIRVVYSDRNVGGMDNGRRVLAVCRGKFVAICEGDDYWICPEKLQQQVSVLSRLNNIDISIHSCYRKSEMSGKVILSAVRSSTDCILTLSEMITDELIFVPTASMVVRRSLLVSIQDWFENTKPPCGDYFLQVFASQRGGAYYINKPMSVYRIDVPGSWTKILNENFDALFESDKEFFRSIKIMEYAIPNQDEAFKHKYIYYYCRFINEKIENLVKMEELVIPMLQRLYGSKNTLRLDSDEDVLNWSYFLKYAVDSARALEVLDNISRRSLYRQSLKVVRSLLNYGKMVHKMVNIQYSESSKYEKLIAKWKTEAQRRFLIARFKQLIKLIHESLII